MNDMKRDIAAGLTSKDDKNACAYAERIISESRRTDEWYGYFEEFASLMNHPKSYVRNRALTILAANARWDKENKLDGILPAYLSHITDEKPITARQCIKALPEVGQAKPYLIPEIQSKLHCVDLTQYTDSMRPLIEKDIQETIAQLDDWRSEYAV